MLLQASHAGNVRHSNYEHTAHGSICEETTMKTFLVGMSIGFGLGVLFAPMKGQEFRETLADRAGDIADTTRESYGRMRQKADAAVSSIRDESEQRTGTRR